MIAQCLGLWWAHAFEQMPAFIDSGAYSVGRMIACLLFVYAQADPLVLNPVDVFKALESLAPDVT